jgi:hypothetical protein
VILNIDILCVVFRIVCEGYSALIVAEDDVLVVDVLADLFEEAEEPD